MDKMKYITSIGKLYLPLIVGIFSILLKVVMYKLRSVIDEQ